MAKIKCFDQSGEIDYFFNSEDHNPPHFHASHGGGEWEIRVFFLKCTEKKLEFEFKFPPTKTGLPSKYRKLILANLNKEDNRGKLYKEWEAIQPKE